MEKHFRTLGYLFIVWAALEIATLVVISLWPGILGARAAPVGTIPSIVLVTVLLVGAFYILTGWSLLTRQSWARTITIAASIVALFSFPLGTALGIYGLWVMFSGEGRRAFESYHRPEAGPSATVG